MTIDVHGETKNKTHAIRGAVNVGVAYRVPGHVSVHCHQIKIKQRVLIVEYNLQLILVNNVTTLFVKVAQVYVLELEDAEESTVYPNA